ncbi:tetratricopeptide repeat protein [Amycolatopsis sp. lyj-112]|uniref:tetratricopeptide repeat protein n=1 Tax=Amycolatopsis sp. lyj-112 TaxID=2789288 RepID=UPI00397E67B7
MLIDTSVPDQIPGKNHNHVNQDLTLERGMAVVRGGDGNQIVVFSGTPGVGKTATAIELSHRARAFFPEGRLFARLSGGLEQPGTEAEVLKDFLLAFRERPEDIPDRLDARRARFQTLTAGRRLQVFLDGATSASQVRTLLPGVGPSLVIVTEGRPLSTLMVDNPVTFLELAPLEDDAAVELFSRLIGEDRVAAERAEVDEIIKLCGHLPIALCVVGAMITRSRRATVASMATRLGDERRRVTRLSLDDDLSVTSVFNAAYRLLGDSAQVCYRALGLRPRSGEIGIPALAAALEMPDYEVLDAMTELADARLVDELEDDRYVVRELVALHAEQLEDRQGSERSAETARLLDFYRQGAIDADAMIAPLRPWRQSLFPELIAGQGHDTPDRARQWLRAERANLRAVVEYAHELDRQDLLAQWCVLLWPFYEKEKFLDDLFATHRLALRKVTAPQTRSLLHTQVGYAHYWLRELTDAAGEFERAVALACEVGSPELEATASEGLGLVKLAQGRLDEARTLLVRSLELAKDTGDVRRIALAELHLAKTEAPSRALELLEHAEAVFVGLDADEAENEAKVLTWRGRKLIELGDYGTARDLLRRALDTMATRGRRFDEAEALTALGAAASGAGETRQAIEHYQEALVIYEGLRFTGPAEAVRAELTALGDTASP